MSADKVISLMSNLEMGEYRWHFQSMLRLEGVVYPWEQRSWRASEKRHTLVLLMVLPVNVDAKVIRNVDCGPGKEKTKNEGLLMTRSFGYATNASQWTIFITYIRSWDQIRSPIFVHFYEYTYGNNEKCDYFIFDRAQKKKELWHIQIINKKQRNNVRIHKYVNNNTVIIRWEEKLSWFIMIYRYHPRLSVLRFFFWHRAGPVILESILPIHILNQARLFGKDLTGFSRKKIVRTWYH
jgi:hypothetical protein